MSSLTETEQDFIERVWHEGKRFYRDLPWRNIDDAYAVLVSEVMLQQTQVSRVLKYWDRWLRIFPTVDALASAETSLVLEMWQGLGYNRRALALKRCAEICSTQYGGALPCTYDELLALPGIGKATAAGIMAFAYNKPAMYLETNVRSVFIHEFYPDEEGVSDKQLEELVRKTCSSENVRAWYYALLDYGSHLKSIYKNPSRRSKHHVRQSTFEGSRRQKRAEVLRVVLAETSISFDELHAAMNDFEKQHNRAEMGTSLLRSILSDLSSEGFLVYQDNERIFLP